MQASLPINLGALGIRSTTICMLEPSAFMASAADTSTTALALLPMRFSTMGKTPYLMKHCTWKSNSGSVDPPTGRQRCSQKAWDRPVAEVSAASLFSGADATTRARLLDSQQKESRACLSAPPVLALGLRLDNNCIHVAVGLRLSSFLCIPPAWAEDTGLHPLSYRRSQSRLPHHLALNDIVKRALVAADIPATLEPRGLCQDDERRPDGVSLIPWARGRSLGCDATCMSGHICQNPLDFV